MKKKAIKYWEYSDDSHYEISTGGYSAKVHFKDGTILNTGVDSVRKTEYGLVSLRPGIERWRFFPWHTIDYIDYYIPKITKSK